jgi:hypothetical protein
MPYPEPEDAEELESFDAALAARHVHPARRGGDATAIARSAGGSGYAGARLAAVDAYCPAGTSRRSLRGTELLQAATLHAPRGTRHRAVFEESWRLL